MKIFSLWSDIYLGFFQLNGEQIRSNEEVFIPAISNFLSRFLLINWFRGSDKFWELIKRSTIQINLLHKQAHLAGWSFRTNLIGWILKGKNVEINGKKRCKVGDMVKRGTHSDQLLMQKIPPGIATEVKVGVFREKTS